MMCGLMPTLAYLTQEEGQGNEKITRRFPLVQGTSFLYFDGQRTLQIAGKSSDINFSLGCLRFHIDNGKPSTFTFLRESQTTFFPFIMTVSHNGRVVASVTRQSKESVTLNEHDLLIVTLKSTLGPGVTLAEVTLRYNRIYI
jgi:hypothetical protein